MPLELTENLCCKNIKRNYGILIFQCVDGTWESGLRGMIMKVWAPDSCHLATLLLSAPLFCRCHVMRKFTNNGQPSWSRAEPTTVAGASAAPVAHSDPDSARIQSGFRLANKRAAEDADALECLGTANSPDNAPSPSLSLSCKITL